MTIESINTESKHYLRMPVPAVEKNTELFIFSGIAIFSGIHGTGSSWNHETVDINADYDYVIPEHHAILPHHWTVNVHLASIFNKNEANNAGWAVDKFGLFRVVNDIDEKLVALNHGRLRLRNDIAVSDSDGYIYKLSYNVTILGSVVEYRSPVIIG